MNSLHDLLSAELTLPSGEVFFSQCDRFAKKDFGKGILMKERPILMNGAMVRAVLDGSKTQTRRIVKSEPSPYWNPTVGLYNPVVIDNGGYEAPGPEIFGASDENEGRKCPYGRPLDRLWVRETFSPRADNELSYARWLRGDMSGPKPDIAYAADGGDPYIERWRPSIHMPRWASRISLEITWVRVERLHGISEEDALAEGIELFSVEDEGFDTAIDKYRDLWESINGPGSWEANPWVWVIEFKRIQP